MAEEVCFGVWMAVCLDECLWVWFGAGLASTTSSWWGRFLLLWEGVVWEKGRVVEGWNGARLAVMRGLVGLHPDELGRGAIKVLQGEWRGQLCSGWVSHWVDNKPRRRSSGRMAAEQPIGSSEALHGVVCLCLAFGVLVKMVGAFVDDHDSRCNGECLQPIKGLLFAVSRPKALGPTLRPISPGCVAQWLRHLLYKNRRGSQVRALPRSFVLLVGARAMLFWMIRYRDSRRPLVVADPKE